MVTLNPFTYGNPISDPKRFIGRRRDVEQIFMRLRNEHGQVAIQIIVLMVRRLRTMDEMVGDMVFLDATTRVAKKLLELADTYQEGRAPSGDVTVPLGQGELSRLVGSSRETVSRALTTYRKMGLLTTSHRRITITNLEGMASS